MSRFSFHFHCWVGVERNIDELFPWFTNFCLLESIFSRSHFSFSATTHFISQSLALLSRFGASSLLTWSFSTESHLSWPKFWVGIQSGLYLSHSFAAFPKIKCLPQTHAWSKMLSVRSSRLTAEIHFFHLYSERFLISMP